MKEAKRGLENEACKCGRIAPLIGTILARVWDAALMVGTTVTRIATATLRQAPDISTHPPLFSRAEAHNQRRAFEYL
jgi:hypothetical protein